MKKNITASLWVLASLGVFGAAASAQESPQGESAAEQDKVVIGAYAGGGASADLGISSTSTVVGSQVNSIADIYNKASESYAKMQASFAEKSQSIGTSRQQYLAVISEMMSTLRQGTTPANPDLLAKASTARTLLAKMTDDLSDIIRVASTTGKDSSLMEYGVRLLDVVSQVSGGVEEDRKNAAVLKGAVAQLGVKIGSLKESVRLSVKETSNFIAIAQHELGQMNLEILDGHITGVEGERTAMVAAAAAPAESSAAALTIPFVNPNVNFSRQLFDAVGPKIRSNANATVRLVAVFPPTEAAQKAARDGAVKVARSLVSMGLSASKIKLESQAGNPSTQPAVQVFVQ